MRFACPCHASAFDITGAVIKSPAPRPLDIYPIFIENNVVKVDTSKPIKRNQFEALAQRHRVEMPITRQVHRILQGEVSPRDAIRQLMERALKEE